MKITIRTGTGTIRCVLPYNGCAHVEAEGACPHCNEQPFLARCPSIDRHDYDTFYGQAHCVKCGARVGEMRATVSTIFGIDEDDCVLNGRPRVY